MIIKFIDDRGLYDHITLLSRDVENNPDLIEWAIDELYAQGCNDFEVYNPTWEETMRDLKAMQTELQKAQERLKEHQEIVDQALWRALDND